MNTNLERDCPLITRLPYSFGEARAEFTQKSGSAFLISSICVYSRHSRADVLPLIFVSIHIHSWSVHTGLHTKSAKQHKEMLTPVQRVGYEGRLNIHPKSKCKNNLALIPASSVRGS